MASAKKLHSDEVVMRRLARKIVKLKKEFIAADGASPGGDSVTALRSLHRQGDHVLEMMLISNFNNARITRTVSDVADQRMKRIIKDNAYKAADVKAFRRELRA